MAHSRPAPASAAHEAAPECRAARASGTTEPPGRRARGAPRAARLALLAGAAVGLFFGWRVFWFLTDDAYVAFRYVSNSILGHGYTWNPPPFRPVEGYTSFLWVVLLDGVWRVTGVEPPDSANVLSLVFAFGTLLVGFSALQRMSLRPSLDRHRPLLGALFLVGCLTNRTFLAWTSSGLETAMFNFFVTLWVYAACFTTDPRHPRRWLLLGAAAGATCLTRPDGLLFAAATLGWIGLDGLRRGEPVRARLSRSASALPLVAVAAHLLWRRATYGLWLPNTYYSRVWSAWPESGVRYLLSFVLEYALWFWLLMLAALAAVSILRRRRQGSRAGVERERSRAPGWFRPGPPLAVGTVLLHVAYYTYVVGGDHFEYRVYSYLIPLIFIAFVWTVDRLRAGIRTSAAAFASFLLLSYPLPWVLWWHSQGLPRDGTFKLTVPIASHFPPGLRWYARAFDYLQYWLIDHYVCMRREEHESFHLFLVEHVVPRSEGAGIPPDGYPVIAMDSVGVVGWCLPHVNVIDVLGLNDFVAARYRSERPERMMAHDCRAPREYVDAWRANVRLTFGRALIHVPRDAPMTAEEIRAIEDLWWRRAREH